MRFYLVTISDITSEDADNQFAEFVKKKKFEWWRYIPLVWIIATPDTVSTNMIMHEVSSAYVGVFSLVLEININDVAGVFPMTNEIKESVPEGWTPYNWFYTLKDENYVPAWER